MRAVKVEYTVKPEYVETNKANIQKVMAELKNMGDVGVMYSTYIKEDGCSFVHFSIYRDVEGPNIIPELETFKIFRDQLKAEGVVTPIQSVNLAMVGRSFDL
jgi:hypothetical protein